MHIKERHINNKVCNYYFDKLIKEAKKYLIKTKKETKNVLRDEKNSRNFVIYFTRYINTKPFKMLNLFSLKD